MASMTIRNLDEGSKQRLRMRAATHGRSMEDEARDILRTTACGQQADGPQSRRCHSHAPALREAGATAKFRGGSSGEKTRRLALADHQFDCTRRGEFFRTMMKLRISGPSQPGWLYTGVATSRTRPRRFVAKG